MKTREYRIFFIRVRSGGTVAKEEAIESSSANAEARFDGVYSRLFLPSQFNKRDGGFYRTDDAADSYKEA